LRGQFGNADAALPAGRFLAEKDLLFAREFKEGLTVRKGDGEFHGVCEAASDLFVQHQTVDDYADRVLFAFLQKDVFLQEHGLSVNFSPREAVLPELLEELSVLSFLGVHEGARIWILVPSGRART